FPPVPEPCVDGDPTQVCHDRRLRRTGGGDVVGCACRPTDERGSSLSNPNVPSPGISGTERGVQTSERARSSLHTWWNYWWDARAKRVSTCCGQAVPSTCAGMVRNHQR